MTNKKPVLATILLAGLILVQPIPAVFASYEYSDGDSGGGYEYSDGSGGGGYEYSDEGCTDCGYEYDDGDEGCTDCGYNYSDGDGDTGDGDTGDGGTPPAPPAPPAPPVPLTLSLIVTPIPYIGDVPLQNVDLRAQVSGTAQGSINYQFDCTADGIWEKEITSSSADYTALDLCSYASLGNFTPKVRITRAGLVIDGTTMIIVK